MTVDRAAVVADFIARIESRDLAHACELLHPEVRYENVPMQPIVGRDVVIAALGPLFERCREIAWPVSRTLAGDGCVANERVDRFCINGTWIELPVAGFFEVDDEGLITLWRDYFDLDSYVKQMAALA
jgi:limonene-1,2-epoxide hydrolase